MALAFCITHGDKSGGTIWGTWFLLGHRIAPNLHALSLVVGAPASRPRQLIMPISNNADEDNKKIPPTLGGR